MNCVRAVTACLTLASVGAVWGQASSANDQLESVQLRDGRRWQGVFLAETNKEVDFAQFIRRPGKPIFAMVRPIPKSSIVKSQRLQGDRRKQLLARYNRMRTRASIELGQIESVQLNKATTRPAKYSYDGTWFQLLSAADEETTKRCVVRVEQVVRAYRQWLPPRQQPKSQLRVLVFGSMEEYRNFLNERGWDIRNPAFYVPDLNMIVAGSDAGRYAKRLAEARQRSADLLKKYERLDADFPERLKGIQQQLVQAGLGDRQIRSELTLRKKAWEDEKGAAQREVLRVNRQNEAKFSVVTQNMFSRLYHEAFHAYLENYVYPRRSTNVPGWLNEGLAQIFEKGQMDDGMLRIDGTNPEALQRIRADYLAGRLMPLRNLLESNSSIVPNKTCRTKNESFLRLRLGIVEVPCRRIQITKRQSPDKIRCRRSPTRCQVTIRTTNAIAAGAV